MYSICDDINSIEKIQSWVEELTNLSPQQIEAVMQTIKKQQVEKLASAQS